MFGRGKHRDEAWTGVVTAKRRVSPDGQNMYHHISIELTDGEVKDLRIKGKLWRTLEIGDRLNKTAGENEPVKA